MRWHSFLAFGASVIAACAQTVPHNDPPSDDAEKTADPPRTVEPESIVLHKMTQEPSEVSMLSVAKGWKVGHQQNDNKQLLVELVPEDESVEKWTQMLTLVAFNGIQAAPESYIETIGSMLADECKNVAVQKWPRVSQLGYQMEIGAIYCEGNRLTGINEVIYMKATASEVTQTLYMWQYARRVAGSVFAPERPNFVHDEFKVLAGALVAHGVCIVGDDDRRCPQKVADYLAESPALWEKRDDLPSTAETERPAD
ncbi:MAG: hypothetical protein B7733_23260 [Myxococcales bacterium FL481]|nr:MAG: hypothetical protein B7733_23260 [Myxococcales bacterium FL481]